jgi:TolB-like protein
MIGLSQSIGRAQTPTTQPAPQVALLSKTPRVEVFAFTPVNDQGKDDWIGRGIQESLQNDVSRTGATLILPDAANGGNEPITTARKNQADLAVIGTYQSAGDDIRVTGHLVDVANDKTVGSFSATGPAKNLFAIEDALGEQLRGLLPTSAVVQQINPVMIAPEPPAPTVVYQPAPQVNYPPPTVNNYYDTSPAYGYAYPDYTYPGYIDAYPFGFYGGIGIYSGGYYGHHFDRGGFHDYHGFGGRAPYGGGAAAGGRAFGTGRSFGAGRGLGAGHAFGGRR